MIRFCYNNRVLLRCECATGMEKTYSWCTLLVNPRSVSHICIFVSLQIFWPERSLSGSPDVPSWWDVNPLELSYFYTHQ
jgi:hypothetical protein